MPGSWVSMALAVKLRAGARGCKMARQLVIGAVKSRRLGPTGAMEVYGIELAED